MSTYWYYQLMIITELKQHTTYTLYKNTRKGVVVIELAHERKNYTF